MQNKQNILFISPREVSECSDGGMVGVFYPLKYFAKESNVYFAFPCLEISDKILNIYKKNDIIPRPFIMNTSDNYLKYPLTIFSKLSFKYNKFFNKRFLEYLCSIIEDHNIKKIWCFSNQTAIYAIELKKKFPNLKFYLREHNIEYKLVKQYAQASSNYFIKLIGYFEYLKTKFFEINSWKYFDKVFFVSDTDLKIAQQYYNSFNISNLIYDGINIKDYPDTSIEDNSFIFTGNLKSFQNKQNLKYFIQKIWKPFIRKVPSAKLYITGNSLEFLLLRLNLKENDLKNLNITNLGYVDNLFKIIKSKKFFLSPTIYGSGLRIKVLYGLALKKLVFATNIDYKMSHLFKDMINIVHYDTADEFYNKYLLLNGNIKLQNKIMNNARNLIKDFFTWEKYIEGTNITK